MGWPSESSSIGVAAAKSNDSLARLRDTSDTLEKRAIFLQTKAETEKANAKRFVELKNKRAALMCIKRKQQYESQAEKLANARMSIEQQAMALENATVNVATIEAMKTGAATMREMHSNMTVDDVDDTITEIHDTMADADALGEAISQPLPGFEIDPDDLEKELASLEAESLDAKLLAASAVAGERQPANPVVVKNAPVASTSKSSEKDAISRSEQEELDKLTKEMATAAM